MNTVTQIFIITIIIIFNINIIIKLHSDKMEYRFAFIWLFAGVSMLAFSIYPPLLTDLAVIIGVGIPLNLLYFLGIILAMYLVFVLTINYTLLHRKFIKVVQNLALLEHEVEVLKNEVDSIKASANKL